MLALEGISAGYGAIQALDNVSLRVPEGKIVCLLGANGAGKTTTLNCISGVVPPVSGTIRFQGQEISRLGISSIVSHGIVQVPEGREIFPELTVADNLLLGMWLRRRERRIANEIDRVLQYFPRLRERLKQPAGTLSGGEQQMLMIGRALLAKPALLLLDEPSLGLSPILIENLFEIIRRIHKEGVAMLIVEQNARVALSVSDYGYILENGEIKFSGPAGELVNNPLVVEAYLGD